MSQEADDKGLAAVVLARLENDRLPRAIDLKEKVDAGAKLDDMDIAFLERVFADTEDLKPMVARNPEYHELAAKLIAPVRAHHFQGAGKRKGGLNPPSAARPLCAQSGRPELGRLVKSGRLTVMCPTKS
jgi:hypothetical protein